jgi:CubicO group peptidase (beta-lactamase class C family)
MMPGLRRITLLMSVMCFSTFLSAQSGYSKLDDWMEANTSEMGGRAILVVYRNDSIVYKKSVSDMNHWQKSMNKYVEKKQGTSLDPFDLDTRILVASCSKWFSAALVMTFVDDGRLRLSDTVGTWLPVLTMHGKGNITISDCLSHLTGVKAPPIKESLKGMKNITSMDQAIEEIANLPMEGLPGSTFHYSNVGLQIAGAVIEKISGKSFETLFAARIAQPLGLKNTDFGKKQVAFPAGGASSTPGDYLHFLIMILHKGNFNGKQILSENAVNEMEMNRMGPDVKIAYAPGEAEGLGYGYGEWVLKQTVPGLPSKWVTSPGLFGSFPWVDNENHYCAFLMTFYLNDKGRQNRYFELKKLVDESIR